ncbi:hypothetical protein RRG08_052666, partial [Elysia crispata]
QDMTASSAVRLRRSAIFGLGQCSVERRFPPQAVDWSQETIRSRSPSRPP